MGLDEARLAIVERLRLIPGIAQGPDAPTPNIPEERMLFVYPIPGTSSPAAHSGKFGGPVITNTDAMIVEWHMKVAGNQLERFLTTATPMLEDVRDLIWGEFIRNRFGNTVEMLTTVATDQFGRLDWGKEETWGFILRLTLTTQAEVRRGKAGT